jgi:hypothetical protein
MSIDKATNPYQNVQLAREDTSHLLFLTCDLHPNHFRLRCDSTATLLGTKDTVTVGSRPADRGLTHWLPVCLHFRYVSP